MLRFLRLGQRIGARNHQLTRSLVAVEVGDRNLERVGLGFTLDAVDPNAIGPGLFQLNTVEPRDTVRGDVILGVTHLVQQLFGDRVDGNHSAGTVVFGDDQFPIGTHFSDGITDIDHVGDFPPPREVTAGTLRAAFQNVTGDRPECEKIRLLPPELIHHRGQDQSGIGAAPGDDDLRALLQSLGDSRGWEVNVGRHDVTLVCEQALTAIHVIEGLATVTQLVQPVHDVVAVDDTDLESVAALTPGGFHDRLATGVGIDASGIGDDLDPALHDLGEDPVYELHEIGGITSFGGLHLLPLHDRHGHFGQVIQGDVINRAPSQHLHRGVHAIAPESLTVTDSYGLGHLFSFAVVVAPSSHCRWGPCAALGSSSGFPTCHRRSIRSGSGHACHVVVSSSDVRMSNSGGRSAIGGVWVGIAT